MQQFNELIEKAKRDKIKLLIEIDTTGKAYIYVRKKDMKWLSDNYIIEVVPVRDNCNFEKDQDVKYLDHEKGKIMKRF